MRIAVTGAAGYLGVNLVNLLVAEGHEVVAIDRTASAEPAADAVAWVPGDVLDETRMAELLTGCDRVFHLASRITLAERDDEAWHLNTAGVSSVASAAMRAGVPRMVHCSSVHAFDQARCHGPLTEESPRADRAELPVYDRSKYAGEMALRRWIDDGLDAVIVNPTGLYGPVDNPARLSRVNRMILDAARGRVPASVAGGFDFVDVRDAARGMVLAAERGRRGENYLLSGEFVTIHQMLATAANLAGRRGPIAPVPLSVVRAILPIAEPIGRALGDDAVSEASVAALASGRRVDGSKARTELGYRPRPAGHTIRDMVVFLVRQGAVARVPVTAPGMR